MGYVSGYGECIGCKRLFHFNPVRVPSIRINGVLEPICQGCVALANPRRRANGLAEIVPATDAYEACEESEI